jgi:hypothetical protein
MLVTVDASELTEMAARMKAMGFSDRRLAAAVATGLTGTARALQRQWQDELRGEVDRPTPLTVNAPIIKMATARDLEAVVSLRQQVRAGTPPSEYLQPLAFGGGRALKKFERALIAQGSMPANAFAIPTDNAERDAYGNVRRQVLVQVLTQLAGGAVQAGYRRVISASAQRRANAAIKAGRNYVAVLDNSQGLYPGIYARVGRELKMIFAYESSARYRKQLSLVDRARLANTQKMLIDEISKAAEKSWKNLMAKQR